MFILFKTDKKRINTNKKRTKVISNSPVIYKLSDSWRFRAELFRARRAVSDVSA